MKRFQVALQGFRLKDHDPASKVPVTGQALDENRQRIAEIQNTLYAERKRSLLIVLQSMDTGGKDPIIRDVLNLTNPQACRAVAFKRSGDEDKKHDRFWRFHLEMAEKGEIVVFNRAYYDEIVADHAHGELKPDELDSHCRQINAFEYLLSEQGIKIIKVFLHISKDEQRRRLQERIDDPTRHWELSESDFRERQYWDGYMDGFEAVIRATNNERAPWFLIPSDGRDYRDLAASIIIRGALEQLDPKFPPPKLDLSKIEWH